MRREPVPEPAQNGPGILLRRLRFGHLSAAPPRSRRALGPQVGLRNRPWKARSWRASSSESTKPRSPDEDLMHDIGQLGIRPDDSRDLVADLRIAPKKWRQQTAEK